MEKFNLKKAILENKATFFSSLNEGEKEYYKDAEADDAEHIDALEKDMEDDKKSSKMKTSELKAKIKEMVLAEMNVDVTDDTAAYDFLAEADEEVAVDDTEVAVDGEENIDVDTTTEVDPNVKAVQDALTQAQAAAQKLGDKKLTDQIGNTITFFTRAHVVDKGAVAEGKLEEFQKPEEDSNIEVLKKRYQFVPLEDLETIASKQDFKVWTIGSPDFDANVVQLGDYIKFPMDSEPALVFQADEQSVNAAYDNAEYSKYNRSLLSKMNREASTGIKEDKKKYYKDAEADDAEHIKALEKDMEDDKKSSELKETLLLQKLAGIITESQYRKKLKEAEEVSPEQAVDKAMNLLPKLEKSSELDKLADKVANDSDLMKQLEKALAQGGVMMNEELKKLDNSDLEKLALNLAKKGAQVKEEYESSNVRITKLGQKEDDGTAVGGGFLAFAGGGTLAAMFSSAIGAAVPALATLFAGPAVAGAVAGVALYALARKVYLKMNPDV